MSMKGRSQNIRSRAWDTFLTPIISPGKPVALASATSASAHITVLKPDALNSWTRRPHCDTGRTSPESEISP